MTFQIWKLPDRTVGLFQDLAAEDQQDLRDEGFHMIREVKAQDIEAAQHEFIQWCRDEVPHDLQVERVQFVATGKQGKAT